MQLMPATAARPRRTNPFDPAQAVDGAARLLQRACSTGSAAPSSRWPRTTPARARCCRYDGIPPYAETQNYVRSVMADAGGRMTTTPLPTPGAASAGPRSVGRPTRPGRRGVAATVRSPW